MAVVEALAARLYRAVGDWRKHGEGADQLLALALWCALGPDTLRTVTDRLFSLPIIPLGEPTRMTSRTNDRNTAPTIHQPTVEYMETVFPERSPDPSDSEREVWMKAGERRAVRHLRNLLNKQDSQPMTTGIRV